MCKASWGKNLESGCLLGAGRRAAGDGMPNSLTITTTAVVVGCQRGALASQHPIVGPPQYGLNTTGDTTVAETGSSSHDGKPQRIRIYVRLHLALSRY